MATILSQILPILYGSCFILLLWQAFRVMARGFTAVPRPGDPGSVLPDPSDESSPLDRTGRLTIHPELLDADGRVTRDDLLTVRFSSDNEEPAKPSEGS